MLGKTKKYFAAFALGVVAAATFVVPVSADPTTVGQFVQELARVKKLAATDPQTAADALSAVGVRLPENLDFAKPLTEGDVASISKASGLKVKATNEAAPFDARQIEQFFAAFSNQLGTSQEGITVRSPGTCVLDALGICAQPGADCEKNGRPGFCQPTTRSCTCNTGLAKGKRKQVVTGSEPE